MTLTPVTAAVKLPVPTGFDWQVIKSYVWTVTKPTTVLTYKKKARRALTTSHGGISLKDWFFVTLNLRLNYNMPQLFAEAPQGDSLFQLFPRHRGIDG